MISLRRAKIVATIGPSLSTKEHIEKAIAAGMNVARLNFSHGDYESHARSIKWIRELSLSLKAPVGILQDLQGPKMRVGKFKSGSVNLVEGEEVVLSPEFKEGKENKIPVDFLELPSVCKEGTKILIDDGLFELKVEKVIGQKVNCRVIYGGELKDRKGLNIPGVHLPVNCLTEKDLKDLEFGLANKVDYVALSFVRRAEDIRRLKKLVNKVSPGTWVIAKIEMLEAVECLEEIVSVSDGIMVARGDLAVEVGQSQLPGMQKRIISLCNVMNTPVITATQILDSMVNNPRPTRAEITDVANAIMDGSDALMLSAESASGKYPFKCIETMAEIILEVEKGGAVFYYDIPLTESLSDTPEAISASACLSALKLDAQAIVCLTTSGNTATLSSSFRPSSRLIAMTHVEEVLNHLELVWGVQTFSISKYESSDEAMILMEEILLNYDLVKPGDKVIVTLGVPVKSKSSTNSVRIITIGQDKISKAFPLEQRPLRCRPSAFSKKTLN